MISFAEDGTTSFTADDSTAGARRVGNQYHTRAPLGLRGYSEWVDDFPFKQRDRDWNKVEGAWRQKAKGDCRRIRVTAKLNKYYCSLKPKKTKKKEFFRTGGKSRWLLACINTGPQPLQIITRGEKPRRQKPCAESAPVFAGKLAYVTSDGVEMIEIAPHVSRRRDTFNEKRPAGNLFDAVGATIWKRYAPGAMRKLTAAYESSASTSQEPAWRTKRREWLRARLQAQAELEADKKEFPEFWAKAERDWPSDPAPACCLQEPPPYHPPAQSQEDHDPILHFEIFDRRDVTPAWSIGIGPMAGVGRLLRSVWGEIRGGPHHMFDKTPRLIAGIGDDLDRLAVSAAIDAEIHGPGSCPLDPAHELITSHLPLAIKIANGFRGYGLPIEDLIAEAQAGLVRATKKYDPQKGAFATYAVHWIKAAIWDYILRSWSLVKMCTTANQKKLFFNLRKAKSQLKDGDEGNMHPDQIEELAKKFGVTEEEVVEMDCRLSGGDVSLNARLSDDEGGDCGEWQDMVADGDIDPEMRLITKEELGSRRQAIAEAMDAVLTAREQRIFVARWLADAEPVTLDALAAEFGVTRERVRQIEERAVEKVQRAVKIGRV
jgi:RNA polymerase sigma-32 factor